ncbi:hypothetical protein GPECTOR_67g330 [Gonium pectorale]|uniref:Uncharacterized protein n=1 Tax=Gonium pectorale TaxID=33097 RepID=A0A150G3N5_GONPE|nr:hypothetical protein GPECTOR_67g330 [Gonium pectorale]|eukprot:KXZ44489.1 hypothetical protein GPECTOR_67g330 [Gonium pectorale]
MARSSPPLPATPLPAAAPRQQKDPQVGAASRVSQSLCSATSLEQLCGLLEEQRGVPLLPLQLGPDPLALGSRLVVGLLQLELGTAEAAGAGPAGRAGPHGTTAAMGAGARARAPRIDVRGMGPVRRARVHSYRPLLQEHADLQAAPGSGSGGGRNAARSVALARRALDSLARRTAALVLAAEASASGVSRTLADAVLCVLWACCHVTEPGDELQLSLDPDLQPRADDLRRVGTHGSATAPDLGVRPSSSAIVLSDGDREAASTAVAVDEDRQQLHLSARTREAEALVCEVPLSAALQVLWRCLLRDGLQPRGAPPRPHCVTWSLWCAANSAPGALPAVLEAVQRAAGGRGGAVSSSSVAGRHEREQLLGSLSHGELATVMWGCARYAEWLRVQDLDEELSPELGHGTAVVTAAAGACLRALATRQAFALLEALAAHPHLRLPDLTACLSLMRHWPPPRLPGERHTGREGCLLRLQTAVLKLLGGTSEEQAKALISAPALGSRGLRPRRGWYRRQLGLPQYLPPERQQPESMPREELAADFKGDPGQQGPVPAGPGSSEQPRERASRSVRRRQHLLPFRLRLQYGISEAEAVGLSGGSVPTSLELQLRHQQRLCADPRISRHGTEDLLRLLAALAAACTAAHVRPAPAALRCALNALALRWMQRGAASSDVRHLVAVLYRLHWRPRAVVSVFTTAWRPFVVLAPGSLSDAALAGMAQVVGAMTSHVVERYPGSRQVVGQALPWPKLRRFWTNLVALATERATACGMQMDATGGGRGRKPATRAGLAVQLEGHSGLSGAGPGPSGSGAARPPPLSVATLVRLVWSSGRQGARVGPFMGLACRMLLPVLPALPPRAVGTLAWGLGQPRFAEPRMVEALLTRLRYWLSSEDCDWSAACHVAWALLRLRRISYDGPEVAELLAQLVPRLHQRWPPQASALDHAASRSVGRYVHAPGRLRGTRAAGQLPVNPRALAALLWAIHEDGGGGGGRGAAGVQQGGPSLGPQPAAQCVHPMALHAPVFRGAAVFLARHAVELPPSAILQVLQMMASGDTPARLRCPEFLDAFGRLVERRPLWLLRTQAEVRLVLACWRRLGWWPAAQVEEVAGRGAQLAEMAARRKLRLLQRTEFGARRPG